jgi:hypothetical protein
MCIGIAGLKLSGLFPPIKTNISSGISFFNSAVLQQNI